MAERAAQDFTVGRVVLTLDPAADVPRLLREAAALAARLDAELTTLFVEDEDVYRSAALPFVRCFEPGATHWRDFDVAEVAREMRRIERWAQRTLAEIAAPLRLRWKFEILRGQASRDLFGGTAETDLWLVSGTPNAMAERLAARAERALNAAASVFLMSARPPAPSIAVVAYDGSPAGRRALAAARMLAPNRAITILVAGAGAAEGARMAREAEAMIHAMGGRGQAMALAQGDLAHIASIVARYGHDAVLVLPASLPALQGPGARAALARVRQGVLLVR